MDNKNKELSRVELHNKKNRKNNPDSTKIFTLPFILVILLFLLPVAYLLMNNLGNGSAQSTLPGGNNKAGQTISVQNGEPKKNDSNNQGEKNVGNQDEQEDNEKKNDDEKKKQEELEKQEQKKQDEAEQKKEAEKIKEAEAKKKQEAEDKRKQEEAERLEKEKEEKEKEQQQSKTHTVQKGETLYRIAMNYYNDPGGVAKIQAANGLSGTDISVGQTLNIP